MTEIVSHESLPSDNGGRYKKWRFRGNHNGQDLVVITEDGQYEHNITDIDDDEEIQIAVGDYATAHDLDMGVCHR